MYRAAILKKEKGTSSYFPKSQDANHVFFKWPKQQVFKFGLYFIKGLGLVLGLRAGFGLGLITVRVQIWID